MGANAQRCGVMEIAISGVTLIEMARSLNSHPAPTLFVPLAKSMVLLVFRYVPVG
jgi:hypothetical protein